MIFNWLYERSGEGVTSQLILRAAKNGDNQIINKFTEIDKSCDVKAIATKRLRSLIDSTDRYAVLLDEHFPEVIKKLLDLGADFNIQDQDQNQDTPLSKILAHLDPYKSKGQFYNLSEILKIIKQFVIRGADLNIKVKFINGSSTPLILASKNIGRFAIKVPMKKNLIKLIYFLIGSGADVNDKDYMGITPIFYAINSCDMGLTDDTMTILKLFLEAGAKINVEDFSHNELFLIDAAWNSVFNLINLYTLYRKNMFKKSFGKVLKTMDLLIDYGADPSKLLYETVSVLNSAVFMTKAEKVIISAEFAAFIIRHGIDIKKEFSEGKTYLTLSRYMKIKTLENLLLGAGAIDPEK
jgi:ankyrin repeat protein